MMANLIPNFIKRATPSFSYLRIIGTNLKPLQLQPPPLVSDEIKSEPDNIPMPLLAPAIRECHNPTNHPQIYYPSFLFGYSLNPVPATWFDQKEADDARTVWADSVKKKRKKKMNKHKYKKLRKRLGRQSH